IALRIVLEGVGKLAGILEALAMQRRLELPSVRGAERIRLEVALGKGLEDTGEFADSFEHYAQGNRLQRATFFYAPRSITAEVQRWRTFYSERFFAERSGWGSARADPIFIVGLPRSGSTLLEQMLASHSQIEGTRELLDLPTLAFGLLSGVTSPTESSFPERVGALRSEEIQTLALRYFGQV